MAKKTTAFCTMCGAPNSKENPVVNIYEGLYMCTECIAFIDGKRDEALNKIKEEVKTEETQTLRVIPKPKEINDFLNQ